MKNFFCIFMALFLICEFVYAAPFSDLPADHWATEAVKVLAEKGLVEGYPDGTFKGDRAATRYEVAMIVARLVAYLEKQKPQVTKEDLDTIQRLVDEYKDELDAMGVRMKNVEDTLASLEKRVTKLEGVKWRGAFETRFATTGITNTNLSLPASLFQFDTQLLHHPAPSPDKMDLWSSIAVNNARPGGPLPLFFFSPVKSGTALTQVGFLRVDAKLSDEWTGGGMLAAYNNQGDLLNGLQYGATPPTLNNPYQLAIFNDNLNVNLDQLYVKQKDLVTAVVGSWRPTYASPFIFSGFPNPALTGPVYVPVQGMQAYGKLGGNVPLRYEIFAGRFPQFSTIAYENHFLGGTLGYDWKNPNITINLTAVRGQNDPASLSGGAFGGITNVGRWQTSTGATPVTLGPQSENIYGVETSVQLPGSLSWLSFKANFGHSDYRADRTGIVFPSRLIPGNLYNAGFAINAGAMKQPGKVAGGAEYLYTDPTYDPFIARYNIPPGLSTAPLVWFEYVPVTYSPPSTTLLGFGGLTNGGGDIFYQMHDSRDYPSNRKGFRTWVNWNYGPGDVYGWYEDFYQTQISNFAASVQPGFYEPLFPTLPAGTVSFGLPSLSSNVERGRTRFFGVWPMYTTPGGEFTLDALWTQADWDRHAPDINNINVRLRWGHVGVTWHASKLWDVSGGYAWTRSYGSGHYLLPEIATSDLRLRQDGGWFSVNRYLTQNAVAWIMYRIFNHIDNNVGPVSGLFPASGFGGTQLQSGLRFVF